ncbi:MAG: peptidase M48 [Bacteroidetes bacterium]|nr:peptidase M48 [Bacteroidota bacterium]
MGTFVKFSIFTALAVSLIGVFQACRDKDGSINIFTIQDDKDLGLQVVQELENDPNIQVLDSATYPAAYKYLYNLRDSILVHNELNYEAEFPWRIRIIKDDTTLNAFCAPGGYIYFYTALIKYLESEDQLAGVMGHEMAHADMRHSTDALTRQYGLGVLFDIVFGKNKGQLVRVAAQIKMLQYSRENESQSDMYSVTWLYPTAYNAKGAAGFFQKLIDQGQSGGAPQWLSTHPNPDNRVQAITDKWQALGGKVGQTFTQRYNAFKTSLP